MKNSFVFNGNSIRNKVLKPIKNKFKKKSSEEKLQEKLKSIIDESKKY